MRCRAGDVVIVYRAVLFVESVESIFRDLDAYDSPCSITGDNSTSSHPFFSSGDAD